MSTVRQNRTQARRHGGQAMTEFQVCAAYVLVPLFLIIPLLAKYIDIKHTAINAARYQAWEYTAWHNKADKHDILKNFSAATIPYKPPALTAAESQRRFFSYIREGKQALPIDASLWVEADRNPLWTDHKGASLYGGSLATSLNTGRDTPGFKIFGVDSGKVVSFIAGIFNKFFGAMGKLFGFLNGQAEFSAINTKGYTRVGLDVPVATYPNAIDVYDTPASTAIAVRAGVLSEGWSSGGTAHTYEQVGGTAPATLFRQVLKLPVMGTIWDVASFMAPELTRCKPGKPHSPFVGDEGSLWFGYVDSDTVHPDRLSGGGTHVCDASGRCRLKPNIPLSHSECIP
ncbi:MAG: hypothetical protein ACE5GZ_00475 [Gammaproteobacteria bacterium]